MSAPGLCAACGNARVVENRRGSRFWMCERSRTDARYPKYPVLPVLACPGFTPRSEAREGERESSEESE